MEWLLIAIAILVIAIIFLKMAGNSNTKNPAKSQYYSKKPLSPPEQVLYYKLKEALPNYEILAQVSFSRFIYTKGGNQKDNKSLNNQARQKVIDFLICKKDFEIIAAIELDDSTHIEEKDNERDKILNSAGIKIIRWNVKKMPSNEEINARLEKN